MTKKSIKRTPYATLIAIVVVAAYYLINGGSSTAPTSTAPSFTATGSAAMLFDERSDGTMVESLGVVERVLPDDADGSRHQRFILKLGNGQTLLVAHNIDVAARIDGLARGDTVKFRGQYESNNRGGVVHWTHHDPGGERPGGWLEHNGRRYR